MMRARAFVPAHITGFFEVYLTGDPLTSGSRGAGLVLCEGVETEVRVKPSRKRRIVVELNSSRCDCEVSTHVAEAMLGGTRCEVRISHSTLLPMSQGFGTSGAGALGTALALGRALGVRKSMLELARIAHRAEVECRTGLGDVIAQLAGGFVVRVRAGAPGVGEVRKFHRNGSVVVFLVGEGLETRRVLSSKEAIERINRAGGSCLELLLETPGVEYFTHLSRRFALETGLARGRVRDAIHHLEEHGVAAGMAMLGDAVFVVCDKPEEVVNLLDYPCIVTGIENRGARLI